MDVLPADNGRRGIRLPLTNAHNSTSSATLRQFVRSGRCASRCLTARRRRPPSRSRMHDAHPRDRVVPSKIPAARVSPADGPHRTGLWYSMPSGSGHNRSGGHHRCVWRLDGASLAMPGRWHSSGTVRSIWSVSCAEPVLTRPGRWCRRRRGARGLAGEAMSSTGGDLVLRIVESWFVQVENQ